MAKSLEKNLKSGLNFLKISEGDLLTSDFHSFTSSASFVWIRPNAFCGAMVKPYR
ncbi:MAG: hypothetical protein ABIP06_14895 [Pyrinomonadaceae bacterium]